jgi:hypothetical protein
MIYASGWVQAGVIYRYGDSCSKYWAEEKASSTSGFTDYYAGCAPQNGTIHNFEVGSYYVNGNWVAQSWVDNTLIHQAPFSVFSWTGTRYIAFDGETYYAESNVPGSKTQPQSYSSMYAQNFTDDKWYDVCGNVTLASVYYTPIHQFWGQSRPTCDSSAYWSDTNS